MHFTCFTDGLLDGYCPKVLALRILPNIWDGCAKYKKFWDLAALFEKV